MLEGNVIAVTSGKGGVGKSTVSVNLAQGLRDLGKKVAIIDLDIYGFSIPKIFNINYKPKTMNGKMIPVEKDGVKVMSMGFLINGNEPVVWRGPMLGKMIQHFSQDVIWGDMDYFILDMPPGTGDVALDMHNLIPHSKEIIVTTPHKAAMHVAERAGTMAIKTNHEILGVVENMSYFTPPNTEENYYIFGKGGGRELAENLHTSLLAQIPLELPSEEDDNSSLYKPGSKLQQEYIELAGKVVELT